MRYLRSFDPWKGKFCSCKVKYSLAPYTGCDHHCLYCYITTYIPNAFNCRPKSEFIKHLPRDLAKADNTIPISISNSSDPYPTIERKFKLTRETIKKLIGSGFKTLLVTKSDLILRDLDLLITGDVVVTLTINTNDDALARRLEPGAPSPSRRIGALTSLISESNPVLVRVDPIIPGLNDDVQSLFKELSGLGVKHITTSTYKARPDSMKRLTKSFPELSEELQKKYVENGEFINRSWYLPREERIKLMKNVSKNAERFGLGFNMCREGLTIPRTSPSCDGVHLFAR